MEFPNKIEIGMPNLSRQEIIEHRESWIELRPDHFVYCLRFRAKQPQGDDDNLPWEEVDNDFMFYGKRSQVTGVEKMWIQKERRWKIAISAKGVGGDIQIFFKKQVECEPIYHQLIDYFFNNNPT